MNTNDEIYLISKAKKDDLGAFSELIKLYERDIRACLAVRLTNSYEADDLAQETFIIAFKKIKEFDEAKPFRPWLRGIAFNLLKNYWRKHTEVSVGATSELDTLLNEQINIEYSKENESKAAIALDSCMEKLDEGFKVLVQQHYHVGLSIKDLTEQYSVGHSTMTMRLYRIRERLKNCINLTLSKASHD